MQLRTIKKTNAYTQNAVSIEREKNKLDMQQCLRAMCISWSLCIIQITFFPCSYNSWMDGTVHNNLHWFTLTSFGYEFVLRPSRFACRLFEPSLSMWLSCNAQFLLGFFSLLLLTERSFFRSIFSVFIISSLTVGWFLVCGNWNIFNSRRDIECEIDTEREKNNLLSKGAFISIKLY